MSKSSREARRLGAVLQLLAERAPAVRPGLSYASPWQLLVATVLSAQCTDERVNATTPGLFARFPTPAALASANPSEVETLIRSIGLFRNKARNLIALAGRVDRDFAGRVPRERADLEALPGVGRKTASVVLGQAFGIPAFAVDTHVGRVCQRLGFAPGPRPEEVEPRICDLLDPQHWVRAHLLLIGHGRRTCRARRPLCPKCPVRSLCPWPDEVS